MVHTRSSSIKKLVSQASSSSKRTSPHSSHAKSKAKKTKTSLRYYKAVYFGYPTLPLKDPKGGPLSTTRKAWYGPHEIYKVDDQPGVTTLTGHELKYDGGEVVACTSGYHCSDSVEGALIHYNPHQHKHLVGSDIEFDQIRVYEVTINGETDLADDSVHYKQIYKYAAEEMKFGEEVPASVVQKALEPVIYTPKPPATQTDVETYVYTYGTKHQDEALGPAYIKKDVHGKILVFEYWRQGISTRRNGPYAGTKSMLFFSEDLLFHGDRDGHPYSRKLPEGLTLEVACAPEHEWDEKTCGAGECWQWNHNPQRYGERHAQKPPKEMFTRKLKPGYHWDWNPTEHAWYIGSDPTSHLTCTWPEYYFEPPSQDFMDR